MAEIQSATIVLSEEQLNDDLMVPKSTAPLLQASFEMCFNKPPLFNGDKTRFRIRGLDAENATLLINGLTLSAYDGRPQMGRLGGINDVCATKKSSLAPPL